MHVARNKRSRKRGIGEEKTREMFGILGGSIFLGHGDRLPTQISVRYHLNLAQSLHMVLHSFLTFLFS
jgi:hypothetical protein